MSLFKKKASTVILDAISVVIDVCIIICKKKK